MKKIAILFSGAGSNLAYILENLHQKEVEVVVAITNNPDAEGILYANEHGVPVEVVNSKIFSSREKFDEELVHILHHYKPDLTVLAGFMRILTPIFTKQIKAINLHPSLLPRHKGMMAIERSYEDEYETGGVSVHWVTEELDGGALILQEELEKGDRSFCAYEAEIKRMEKPLLCKGIRLALEEQERATEQ